MISIQSNTSLPVRSINLLKEIEKTVASIPMLISNANTSITYAFDHDERLVTNPAYFESIVLNLLTNALKYKSPDRPLVITISLESEGKYKIVCFRDNGLGIDLDRHKEKLFGMYNTFHGNKDAKGLGLFIMKAQIEAMKGKIDVESELNAGTAFKLYFINDLGYGPDKTLIIYS